MKYRITISLECAQRTITHLEDLRWFDIEEVSRPATDTIELQGDDEEKIDQLIEYLEEDLRDYIPSEEFMIDEIL